MGQQILVVILSAYLIGSIPFSHLITEWRTGLNLREVGEGNVGSRNVWHIVGPSWGLLAGFLDCLKGYTVFKLSSEVVPPVGVALAGIAVLLGHQFPIFLRGRGGKGLATALGVLLGLSPLSTLCALLILGLSFFLLRDFNPSLAVATIAIILLPIAFREPLWVSAYALALSLLAALKKALDMSHESRVWRDHPWQGASTPGWQKPASEEPPGQDNQPH
ncbi:MAG: glycerol-3-phosphate acyltransferase [Ktedonobacterales bacterium]